MTKEKILTQEQEKYIEHEVKLRVLDERFKSQEKNMIDIKNSIIDLNSKLTRNFIY